ncbi:MAG: hypothetical protein WC655_19745, partial [Candidatus Hydrogenedentales bacterium]
MKQMSFAALLLCATVSCTGCGEASKASESPQATSLAPQTEKDILLKAVTDGYTKGQVWDQAQALAKLADPTTIPVLIGVIDSDNSYYTVYGIGYFALGYDKLGELTGVRYSPYHDGAWWRRWWDANKSRFPKEAQDIPIPDLPKTANG